MPKVKKVGKVYLTGAGPGDPGLLTLKAKRVLEKADVVLYDFLVHPNILDYVHPKAILQLVGKRKGFHQKQQSQINQLLLNHAQKGRQVVRLKGGDPSIFGRLGEEMTYLKDNGIPFEVIPGVSSATAVPVYAGIPITHRDISRSVAFVTGTTTVGTAISDIDFPEADTLVFLMGMTHLGELVETLLQSKRFNEKTPATI
ncbi:MAG: uroporphyrinogen-III C-methyltransferase, partial [Candidatus Margulisbacteria bacterium]|nr:uroporphyrinogen-III C-methyltransferase [Candidatus Margulisiibacteriota bacterium]